MDAKTCFFCSEPIEPGTTKCPHCGEALGQRDLAKVRPRGWGSPEKPMTIAVIGWLCLITGGLGVMGLLINLVMYFFMGSNPMYAQTYAQSWGPPGSSQQLMMFVTTGLGAVASALNLVAGYGLLRLRLWGRNLALGLAIYGVVGSIVAPLFTVPMMLKNNQAAGMEAIIIGSVVGGVLIGLVWYGLVIFFLLRPHVGAALRKASGVAA